MLGWRSRRRMHTSRSTRLALSSDARTSGMRLRATSCLLALLGRGGKGDDDDGGACGFCGGPPADPPVVSSARHTHEKEPSPRTRRSL